MTKTKTKAPKPLIIIQRIGLLSSAHMPTVKAFDISTVADLIIKSQYTLS